jgi:hypothetical protein
MATGHSVTGILHLFNQTLLDCCLYLCQSSEWKTES